MLSRHSLCVVFAGALIPLAPGRAATAGKHMAMPFSVHPHLAKLYPRDIRVVVDIEHRSEVDNLAKKIVGRSLADKVYAEIMAVPGGDSIPKVEVRPAKTKPALLLRMVHPLYHSTGSLMLYKFRERIAVRHDTVVLVKRGAAPPGFGTYQHTLRVLALGRLDPDAVLFALGANDAVHTGMKMFPRIGYRRLNMPKSPSVSWSARLLMFDPRDPMSKNLFERHLRRYPPEASQIPRYISVSPE